MAKKNGFGYPEELQRSMGGFSSFAVSFSLISVLTGIFANFSFGYQQAGGSVIWSWSLVASGQLLVALVLARLAFHYPIAGYGYQWAARLVDTKMGFFVGWFLLIQFLTGFPGICQTFTTWATALMGITLSGWQGPLATVGVITLVTFVHRYGMTLVARVNDAGVFTEMVGVLLLLVLLAGAWLGGGIDGGKNLMEAFRMAGTGTLTFSSFSLSMLLGAWCLTGFEAAADLAEETQSPQRHVPRAVIVSHVSASLSGLFLLVLLCFHAWDLPASESGNLIAEVLLAKLGSQLTAVVMVFVLISILACAIASMATASRLLFSLARDRILPYSAWLARVNPRSKSPANATLFVGVASSMAILFLQRIEMITSVSALATYLGYAGILLAVMLGAKRLPKPLFGGAYGAWIPRIALLWVLAVAAALAIPENPVPGFSTLHLPLWSTLFAAGIGLLLYLFHVRWKIRKGLAGPPTP